MLVKKLSSWGTLKTMLNEADSHQPERACSCLGSAEQAMDRVRHHHENCCPSDDHQWL